MLRLDRGRCDTGPDLAGPAVADRRAEGRLRGPGRVLLEAGDWDDEDEVKTEGSLLLVDDCDVRDGVLDS